MHSWQPKFVPTHPWKLLDGQDSLMEEEITKNRKPTCQSRNPSFLVTIGLLNTMYA
ncbi:hypothetical protein Taro_005619 [Colocasia esculenta]|uniref:Uncharacterized protein n=1 Tax=Colocasia esculenta TaxID=4460 RepID=A0A843TNQ3_COLES|nr:hypothetical protein [Colocasia esculenta]